MTNQTAKERIGEYKRRLEAITTRRKEHKEEEQLRKQLEKEEKKYIREEKFRAKHPKLYRAKQVAKAGGRALGYGVGKAYESYRKMGKQKYRRKLKVGR